MPATIHTLYPAKVVPNAIEREADERYLALLAELERHGIFVVTEDDAIPLSATMILEPRELVALAGTAAKRQPRIPQARGIVHEIMDMALAPFRPAGA